MCTTIQNQVTNDLVVAMRDSHMSFVVVTDERDVIRIISSNGEYQVDALGNEQWIPLHQAS